MCVAYLLCNDTDCNVKQNENVLKIENEPGVKAVFHFCPSVAIMLTSKQTDLIFGREFHLLVCGFFFSFQPNNLINTSKIFVVPESIVVYV